MCIRDRVECDGARIGSIGIHDPEIDLSLAVGDEGDRLRVCLLYTSDAADERSSVDLGGRRIIKKKNTYKRHETTTT